MFHRTPAEIERDLDRLLSEKRLIHFVRLLWDVVEPGRPFVNGWAIEAIAEHLEAITSGEITRLVINVPPGFSKSTLLNVMYPAWEWGPCGMPEKRFLSASYSDAIPMRDNDRFRRIIESDVYQTHWGHVFRPSPENWGKIKLENDKAGWKQVTSIGAGGTGLRADRFLLDDPNNAKDGESEAIRLTTNIWLRETLPTRLNPPLEQSAIILIQQRIHEDDATNVMLDDKLTKYTHLMIPMEYDSRAHCTTSIGWTDPRSVDNELAWPELYNAGTVARLKSTLGPYATASQLQQTPSPRGGGIIKEAWWQLWGNPGDPNDPTFKVFPPFEYIVASLDTAYTDKTSNDYSACTVWGMWHNNPNVTVQADDGRLVERGFVRGQPAHAERGGEQPMMMLLYAWQERLEFPDLVERTIDTCEKLKVDTLLIENKAAGISVSQELRRQVGGGRWNISMSDPTRQGDKTARLYAVQHLFAEGLVWTPDKAWADMVIQQVSSFPKGSHDDLVDCVSMGLRHLRGMGYALRKTEYESMEAQTMRYKPQVRPLYDA